MKLIKIRRNSVTQLRNLAIVLLVLANVYIISNYVFGRAADRIEVEIINDMASASYMGCHEFRLSSTMISGLRGFVTVRLCKAKCMEKGMNYALLQGGSKCYCSNVGGDGIVHTDGACTMPCSGNATEHCGGAHTASVYTVRIPDGNLEWTPWMTLEDSGDMRRLRGCSRQRFRHTREYSPVSAPTYTCTMSIERKMIVSSAGGIRWSKPFESHYIGCFTLGGFASIPPVKVGAALPEAVAACLELCSKSVTAYAAVVKLSEAARACTCMSSLGTSRPLDTCSSGYGATVFSTTPIVNNSISLKFEADRPQVKILLLGYFRGGTTFASSLLNRYPGAFYTYEPDSMLGVKWKGIDSFGSAIEMNNVFAEKVLDRYFRCDMYKIPGHFLSWYPDWGEDNVGFDSFEECKKKLSSTAYGLAKCIPVLEESCRRSDLVVAKTTRFLASSSVEAFVKRNPDLRIVHLVRDPRGTLASRQRVSAYFREDVQHHSQVLCKEILAINDLFAYLKDHYNVHTMHYEDLAVTPMKAAGALYRNLEMDFLQQMKDHIQQVTASNKTHIRNYFFSIHRSDAAKHATSWKQHLKMEIIRTIDSQCLKLYEVFNEHYSQHAPLAEELP